MRYLFTQEKSFKKVAIPIDNSRCVRYLVLNETGELPRFRGLRLLCASLGSLTISAHAYEQASAALLLVTYDSKGACEYIEKSENGNDLR